MTCLPQKLWLPSKCRAVQLQFWRPSCNHILLSQGQQLLNRWSTTGRPGRQDMGAIPPLKEHYCIILNHIAPENSVWIFATYCDDYGWPGHCSNLIGLSWLMLSLAQHQQIRLVEVHHGCLCLQKPFCWPADLPKSCSRTELYEDDRWNI